MPVHFKAGQMGEICADSSMKENQLLLGTASAECCTDFWSAA